MKPTLNGSILTRTGLIAGTAAALLAATATASGAATTRPAPLKLVVPKLSGFQIAGTATKTGPAKASACVGRSYTLGTKGDKIASRVERSVLLTSTTAATVTNVEEDLVAASSHANAVALFTSARNAIFACTAEGIGVTHQHAPAVAKTTNSLLEVVSAPGETPATAVLDAGEVFVRGSYVIAVNVSRAAVTTTGTTETATYPPLKQLAPTLGSVAREAVKRLPPS